MRLVCVDFAVVIVLFKAASDRFAMQLINGANHTSKAKFPTATLRDFATTEK